MPSVSEPEAYVGEDFPRVASRLSSSFARETLGKLSSTVALVWPTLVRLPWVLNLTLVWPGLKKGSFFSVSKRSLETLANYSFSSLVNARFFFS